MIREIRGTVLSVEATGAVVDVAGWGVFVHTADTGALAEGASVSLKTYLAVKQDGVDLYGFATEEDRAFFELLLSVSGVGPKTALSILRRAPRADLEGAIGKRDIAYLTRVVGLGKKAAEKLSVELSEKIAGRGGGARRERRRGIRHLGRARLHRPRGPHGAYQYPYRRRRKGRTPQGRPFPRARAKHMGSLKRLLESLLPRSAYRVLLAPYHLAWTCALAFYYGFPASKLTVIGVTGTKGKSSVTEMLAAILTEAGHTVAVSSTIRFAVGSESRRISIR